MQVTGFFGGFKTSMPTLHQLFLSQMPEIFTLS